MKLSKNLSLHEVTKSQTALRRNISNEPTEEHLENLKILAERVFQPIRDYFNEPIYISSGYRSKALNKAIGGSKTSQHCLGQAIDIDQDNRGTNVTNMKVFNYIRYHLDFDQLIFEYSNPDGSPAWIHVSYNKNGNRNEILRAVKVGRKTIYHKWNN